jgi:stage V sporulation protein B
VIHSCLSGYFIGRKNVSLSAASQLIEQLLRIGSVFFFYVIFKKNGRTPDAAVMALGQLAGELAAALFCIGCLFCRPVHTSFPDTLFPHRSDFRRMCSVSAPLGLNRMLTCVLQGIEAALLPQMLIRFGHDSSDALAVYGTLTGMALPLILFPTAITGSLGTLLLPAISESHALHQDRKIADTTRASFFASLLLGYFFLILFRFCGNTVGTFLFHSETAGSLIRSLALICPFLYVNTTLYSILHALGKTTVLTVGNVFCFAVRLLFVVLFVPEHGINGYLTGTIVSQGLMTLICLTALRQYLFPSQQKKNSPDTGFSLRQRLCH